MHHSTTAVQVLGDIADIDANTAKLLATVLQPFLSISILLMIIRIVLSWYPQIPGNKMPWAVAYKPTEPILGPTRNIIKPVGGVDISPIIWVALLSFINEILLGPQGILNLLQRKIDLP
ncbi:g2869 [Coccomyxa viridis]|uniref:G2869 protein n=1 Tax=Coccomyxa viridis TaxID=1274662 RepID=A0ABP1FN28_9CHLO